MSVFGQLVPGVVFSWVIVGLDELREIKYDESNDQRQYEDLNLREKGNNLTAYPILHFSFVHLGNLLLSGRRMHHAYIQILFIGLILSLAAGTSNFFLCWWYLFKAEISIMPMHLANDVDIRRIVVE